MRAVAARGTPGAPVPAPKPALALALALALASALVLTATTAVPVHASPQPGPTAVPHYAAPLSLDGTREAIGTATAAAQAEVAGVDWKKCPSADELPPPVECGTVAVPVDYARPHGAHIRLTLSRGKATGPASRHQGPLLYNPGGPGGSGMPFPLFAKALGGVWKKLNSAYDMVGYAPRGVGRSAPLSCRDPKTSAKTSPKTSAKSPAKGRHHSPLHPSAAFKSAMRARAASYAKSCARNQGAGLDHYTTPDNARDLDVLRAALGRQRLTYLGASYGTYIGSVYATLFPHHVRRLVLDSVVDPRPEKIWYESNLEQNPAFQRRWNDWKFWVARHDAVYGLGRTRQAVQRQFDAAREAFDHGDVDSPSARGTGAREVLSAFLNTGYDDRTWAGRAAALADFHRGRPQRLTGLASPGQDPKSAAEQENSNAVYHAVQCSDAPWPRDWSRWNRDNTALARRAPFNTWENAWTNLPCAYWPRHGNGHGNGHGHGAQAHPVDVRTLPGELPPVLLLAATRDAATPYKGAVETWRRLSGSSLVTEKGAGTHGVTGGNACADAHLSAYLLHGRTPGRSTECPARRPPKPVYDKG